MPETINRRCPQCGRKAHDRLLVQCPDCRVPFVLEEQPASSTLTPEQIRLLAAQVFGSWKFWAVLLVVVAGAAWAIVAVADRVIDARAKTYLSTLEQQATNHIGSAFAQFSNQLAVEFRQPRIQNAIEQVARQRAAEIITNGVRPSLESFLDAMDAASSQLAQSSNRIAQLERDALAAQKRIPPPEPAALVEVQASNPPVATAPAPKPTVAANSNPAPDDNTLKLTLASQSIVPAGSNYFLTLMFKPNNNSANGLVTMDVGTFNHTATIESFSAVGSTAEPVFNPTADAARLQFNVTSGSTATVVVVLSAPTIVRVSSDALVSDVTIPVAADKMQIPSASNKPAGNQ
jgi:hypothetical protein